VVELERRFFPVGFRHELVRRRFRGVQRTRLRQRDEFDRRVLPEQRRPIVGRRFRFDVGRVHGRQSGHVVVGRIIGGRIIRRGIVERTVGVGVFDRR